MLVFIVPLKSAQVSRSWEQVSLLLERCVRSLCNQTSDQFRVIVVCHEQPLHAFHHRHLHYLQATFPPPIVESQNGIPSVSFEHGHTDKGRKILRGLRGASDFQPCHTMVVDADDCVNRHLAEFVSRYPNSHGWFFQQGYRYREGNSTIYLKRRNFYRMCGSSYIVRYDLNPLPPSLDYSRGYGYYKTLIDHEKMRELLHRQGTPLQPLPFAGAVYIVGHGENLYYEDCKLGQGLLKRFNLRTLTPAQREIFGLYEMQFPVSGLQILSRR